MSACFFPHSQLLFTAGRPVVVVSGFHVQLLDESTGTVIQSTLNSSPNVQESLKKSGPIRCAILDPSGVHLATLADDKKLKVWKVDGLELLHERELPKRPTSALFTADGQTIVVADKFGDVFSYPLHPPPPAPVSVEREAPVFQEKEAPAPVEEEQTPAASEPMTSGKKRKSKKPKRHENPPRPRNSVASHVNTSDGTLVLGHTSLLTAFLLTPDSKYIITADRDEHIRVSWYPQGYCIESFCLGSTQFVSAIHLPPARPDVLISGGGDSELKVWDWLSGALKTEIAILDSVKDYIKVMVKPYKRPTFDESTPSAEEPQKNEAEHAGEGSSNNVAVTTNISPALSQTDDQTVLAVQKISTLKDHILFCVTGGTALFAVAYPNSDSNPSPSLVSALDFDKPILDFAVDSANFIWVSLDVNWPEITQTPNVKAVRLASLSADGQLSEVSSTSASPLLEALNTKTVIPASAEDLSLLNFYSSLNSLPKNTGGDSNEDEDDLGNAARSGTPQAGTGIPQNIKTNTRKQSQGPGGGKKEQGKLKSKLAVEEKRKKATAGQTSDKDGEPVLEGESRDSKRLKSEDPASSGVLTEDVQMAES